MGLRVWEFELRVWNLVYGLEFRVQGFGICAFEFGVSGSGFGGYGDFRMRSSEFGVLSSMVSAHENGQPPQSFNNECSHDHQTL